MVAERFGLSRREAREAVRRGQVDVAGQTASSRGERSSRRRRLLSSRSAAAGNRRAAVAGAVRGSSHPDRGQARRMLTQPTPDRERDTLLERAGRYLARTRGVQAALCRHRAPDRPGHLGRRSCWSVRPGRCGRSRRCFGRTRSNDRTSRSSKGSIEPRARNDRPAAGGRSRRRPPRGGALTGRRCAGDHALRSDRAIRRHGRPARRAGSKPVGRIRSGFTWPRSGHPVVGEPVYRPQDGAAVSRCHSRARRCTRRRWVSCTR